MVCSVVQWNPTLANSLASSEYSLLFVVLLSSFCWKSVGIQIASRYFISSADHCTIFISLRFSAIFHTHGFLVCLLSRFQPRSTWWRPLHVLLFNFHFPNALIFWVNTQVRFEIRCGNRLWHSFLSAWKCLKRTSTFLLFLPPRAVHCCTFSVFIFTLNINRQCGGSTNQHRKDTTWNRLFVNMDAGLRRQKEKDKNQDCNLTVTEDSSINGPHPRGSAFRHEHHCPFIHYEREKTY